MSIPVAVNGDIESFDDADAALAASGADAVMVGRGAQGRPWFPGQLARYLATGVREKPPRLSEQLALVSALYGETLALYGVEIGLRHARKHLSWALDERCGRGKRAGAFAQKPPQPRFDRRLIPRACSLFSLKHSTPSAPRARPVLPRLKPHKSSAPGNPGSFAAFIESCRFPRPSHFSLSISFTGFKEFPRTFGLPGKRGKAIRRQQMAPTSLARTNGAAIGGSAVMSKGVEYALMAAGATVALIATVQSLGIVASWV